MAEQAAPNVLCWKCMSTKHRKEDCDKDVSGADLNEYNPLKAYHALDVNIKSHIKINYPSIDLDAVLMEFNPGLFGDVCSTCSLDNPGLFDKVCPTCSSNATLFCNCNLSVMSCKQGHSWHVVDGVRKECGEMHKCGKREGAKIHVNVTPESDLL